MLRVRLLGGLELEADGRAVQPPPGRPARALLAWLALNPGMHARSRVAAALWPDVLDQSARLSLRTALSALRQALVAEADAVSATREQLGLAPDVWLDVRHFDELVAAGRLEEAVELHRGELLPELDHDWVLEARDERRSLLAEAIARLADANEKRGDLEAAVRRSRELVAIDPLSEERQRALIRRLALSGDRGAALAACENLRERLARELGIAPAPETRELAEHIRRGEVERPAAAVEQPPLPPVLARRYRSRFVGRRQELARLREWWELASRGERQLVVVFGEPGIGKSRLVAELARGVHAEGATVLLGRCSEEPLLPYQPFVEALRPYLHPGRPGGGLGELTTLVRDAVGRADAGSVASDAPGDARFRLFEAVSSLLTGASEQRLLLVLEDLHWADKPTLLLLWHLVSAPEPARLLVLVTYRETELRWADPLARALAELRRESIGARLRLGGLDEQDVAALVTAWIGAATSAQLAQAVHSQTEGNPFFVEEVLSHLSESGAALADLGVPEGVKEVVGHRLTRLSEETRRTLVAACVLGRRFDLHVLGSLLEDLHADRLADALEEAASAGLVRDEPGRAGRYAFSHALIRETLYERLAGAHRARLHAKAAGALERLHGERLERAGEIAHHLFEAGEPDAAARGIDYAVRAAELAFHQLAYEDAGAQLERALRALELVERPDETRRCELLLSLGDARMRAGERSDGRAAFGQAATAARALRRPDLRAHAALGFGGIGVTVSTPDDALIPLLEEALGSLDDAELELRARLLARLALEHYYLARERSETLSALAVGLARQTGDERALASVLGARHVALWTPDHVHERYAIANEMIQVAERAGDQLAALQGRNWRILDLFELGDIDAVEQQLDEYARLAEELKLPSYRWYVPLWRSTLAMLRGRLEEARDLAEDALAFGRRAQDTNAELFHRIVLSYHLPLEEGRFGDADLEFQRRKARDAPAAHLAAAYRIGAARILAERGDLEEARHELDLVAGEGFATLPKDVNWLSTLAEAAEVTAIVHSTQHADALYALLLPHTQLNVVEGRAIYCYGSVAYYLGLLAGTLGRLPAALEHFEAARACHERMEAGPLRYRTLHRHAEALLRSDRRDDHRRAGELAHEALIVARTIGTQSLIERAQAAAAAGGSKSAS